MRPKYISAPNLREPRLIFLNQGVIRTLVLVTTGLGASSSKSSLTVTVRAIGVYTSIQCYHTRHLFECIKLTDNIITCRDITSINDPKTVYIKGRESV